MTTTNETTTTTSDTGAVAEPQPDDVTQQICEEYCNLQQEIQEKSDADGSATFDLKELRKYDLNANENFTSVKRPCEADIDATILRTCGALVKTSIEKSQHGLVVFRPAQFAQKMMPLLLFRQPRNVEDMSMAHRILIFLIALFESITWSGAIFGWPQIVQVMKMNGIYSHLCKTTIEEGVMPFQFNSTTLMDHQQNGTPSSPEYIGCSAQDERYALIYTICCVLYATPGIVIGYSLHHFGLAVTRVAAGLMLSGGFLLLSAITIETPDYLWGGAILISVGGNTIRMSGLQFGNLFPDHCAAAMSVLSGIFSASAAVFILFTYGSSIGFSWRSMCYFYSSVASFILFATCVVPLKHIPYNKGPVDIENLDEGSKEEIQKQDNITEEMISNGVKEEEKGEDVPLKNSLCSISNILNVYWLFVNFIGITIFATFFNSWISRISQNVDEALYYTRLYGYANIFCVFFTFLPGFLISVISKRLKRGLSGLEACVAEVQGMIIPLVVVSVTCTVQFSCLLLDHSWAVYLALVCLAINRPACLGVGNPFTRIRFPAEHFNRMIGIQGTFVSILTLVQYPHFLWAQNQFYFAIITVLVAMIIALSHPLHLLNKKYIAKSLKLKHT